MASMQIASMLDELMGRNRNLAPDDENNKETKWTDPDVCKYYLVLFCPHDLFVNTKADLGPCGKIHDDDLKQKFAEEKESYRKAQYLDDFQRFCQKSLSDLHARIKKAKERLLLTQQAEEAKLNAGGLGVSGGQNREVDEKIILLSEKISALVAEAEEAGCRGDVEEAQGLMKLCDQLREERDTIRRSVQLTNLGGANDYTTIQKAMEVCDICGAFLIIGDAQQRIDDHLLGKQHMGFARLRTAIDTIDEKKKQFREEREKEAEERRKKRESSSKNKRSGSRDRRSRSRDRSNRDRDRNRDKRERDKKSGDDRKRSDRGSRRDRSRDRKRSRSRDRRRSRSRGDRRRSRSRGDRRGDRRRSKSRDRRRSRSRDRTRRSRSRDRKHDKRDADVKAKSKSPVAHDSNHEANDVNEAAKTADAVAKMESNDGPQA